MAYNIAIGDGWFSGCHDPRKVGGKGYPDAYGISEKITGESGRTKHQPV